MPNLTIDLSSLTGKTVPIHLYGFSTGALGDNSFANAANPTTKNPLITVKPTFLRVNANQQIVQKYGTGSNTGYMDNWWNNRAAFMDPNHILVMPVGPSSDTGLPYSPAQEATFAQNFAIAMRNAGHEITWWEVGNESLNILPNVSDYLNYFIPIARALHGVNANYKVGGPATTWWGAYDPAQFANGVAAGDCDFYEFHAYNFAGVFDHATIYNGCASFGDANSIRTALRNTKLANVPIILSEWNLDGTFNPNQTNGQQQTYVGAVADALLLTSMWRADPSIIAGGYWDPISDPFFGAIETDGTIRPTGYYLGYAGQHMGGAEVAVSGVSGNLQVLPTKNGNNVAIQLVNYDTSTASPNNITITGGAPSGPITRWELGKSNQTTPNVTTQASLSSVNVPSEQIVILTFSTAAAQKSLTVSPITGVQVGSTFTVSGTLTNYPSTPSLLYSDDGGSNKALPAGANVTSSTFSFTHPAPTIAGNHTIVVTDGTVSASAAYNVVDIAWQSRPLTGSLSDTISGLQSSASYDFRVSAQNSVGTGPFSTVITSSTSAVAPSLPGAPGNVRSSAVASSSVTLTWNAPTTGSAPFTYRVQSSPAGLGTWTNRGTAISGTSLQVTGLAASTSYDFRVFATNSVAEGPASATYTVSTASAVPTVTWDPANAGGGVALSNNNLTATATGSATPGTAFQGVRSTLSRAAGKFAFEVTINALSQDMEIALVNGNHAVTNDAGEDVNAIAFYPSGGGGSQAPMSVYQGGVQVLVPSGSPISDSPGSIVTFCVDIDAKQFWVASNAMRSVYGAAAWNDSASANPSTGVGGLPINVSGALFICFFDSEGGAAVTLNAGSSAFSSIVPASFPAWGGAGTVTAPGAVTNLSASPSSTSVGLSWSAPTSGTTPFTYHMQMSPTGANQWTDQGTSATATGTVAGLIPGTGYDFRVYASNSAGNGGFSNTVAVSTTSGVAGTTFDEEFGTLSLLNSRNTAAGGTWQPVVWYTDANASPDGQGIDDGWFVNPFNPATPINDIYTINNGSLNLAIEARPAGIDPAAVGNKPYMTGQLQTNQTFRQAGGYFESRLAVPKLAGTMFAWWFYSDLGNQMNLEIPTVQGGGQFAKYSLWNQGSQAIVNEFYTYNMANPIDCSQFHIYGIDWNPPTGQMTFYIDSVQVMQAPIPAGFTDPMWMFLSTYTGDPNWFGSINPASTQDVPLGLYAGVPGDAASGSYPGFDAQWDGFSTTMARPATLCLSYMNSDRSPTDGTFGWAAQASFYSGQLHGNTRTVNAIPIIAWPFAYDPGTGAVSVAAAIAAGTHDALIQTCLGTWKTSGYSTIYIRPAWEFNIGTAQAVPTVITLANFLAAFQHFYTLVHNYAAANGMTIKVIWNPNVGNNQNSPGLTVAQQYPGDAFVDILGIDTYGAPVDGTNPPTNTTSDPTQYLVSTMFNMAVSSKKPVAFCEVGGRDTTFANQMGTALNSRPAGVAIEFFAMWDIDDSSGNLSWTNAGDAQTTLANTWKGLMGAGGTVRENIVTLPIKAQVDYVRAYPIGHGPGSGVAAQPVTTFLSSLGVNVHIDQGFSANSYITPLQFTGIKNIRTGFSNISGAVTAHNATGCMVNVFGSSDLTSHLAAARTLATNNALLSLEGPNEPNNFPFSYLGNQGGGSGTWVPVAQYQRDLYAGVKADTQLQNFPVFHVSEGGGETDNVGMQFLTIPNGAGIAMPDGTKYADYANPHNYVSGNLGGQYVDNTAWNAADPTLNSSWDGLYVEYGRTWRGGFAGYSNAQLLTLPRVTSETGWDSTALGETVQGKVLLNTYLSQFKRGWRYTFIYEMFDQEASSGNQGLYRSDKVTAKLAATYIHNLTTILAGGSNLAPSPLNYSIANQPATVHDLLLQKTGNVYDLIVWGEQVSGSNNVTVNLAVTRSSVKVFDPTVGTSPVQTLTNARSVSLSVSDHPFIIEITL